jgi:hypothetical protein
MEIQVEEIEIPAVPFEGFELPFFVPRVIEGTGTGSGDFEGDYTGGDEELVNVNISLPSDITIVWMELNGTPTLANTNLQVGPMGATSTFVDFYHLDGMGSPVDEGTEIAQTSSVVRHLCHQFVPAGGFILLNIGDWEDPALDIGTSHYKIHYTTGASDTTEYDLLYLREPTFGPFFS